MQDLYTFFYENFIEVLQYDFYQRALISSLLISVVTSVVSVVVVNKNWAMLGMGLSNSVFPGVVIGTQFSFPLALTLGAFSTGLLCFYLTNFIVTHSKLKKDAALGMCYTCFFALGLVILAFVHTQSHVQHILFGNLLGIRDSEYYGFLIVAGVVVIFNFLKFKDIILYTFDERQFQILGLNFKFMNNFMLVILTLTIITCLQVVGILLTVSYLVLPTATGQLVSKRLKWVITIGLVASVLASYLGLSLAYILDISTGPTIVAMQSLFFLIAYATKRLRELVHNQRKLTNSELNPA